MKTTTRFPVARWLAAGTFLAAVAVPAGASAQVEEGRARYEERAFYPLELEPHFTFGPDNVYGNSGYGAGLRLGLPLVAGHLGGSISDNLALSFGGDIVHYDNCWYSGDCNSNYFLVPVALQWNVFLGRVVSLFAEGGGYLYKGWLPDCGGGNCGGAPPDLGILPTLALGGRIHVGSNFAITGRIGYPTTTIGVSFM